MKDSKENIDKLSKEANELYNENVYLKEKLELYNKYIISTKKIVNKFISDDKTPQIDIFRKYVEQLQKDYDKLKEDYDKKYYPKYQELLEDCLSDITFGKPILNQYKNEEFMLDYLKKEKEDIIKGLKNSIEQSKKYNIFREKIRDVLVDLKKGDEEMGKVITELQQNMLYELKKCNRFSYRIKKYNNLISDIKNNIDILDNYIKKNPDLIKINNTNDSKNPNNNNDKKITISQMKVPTKDPKHKKNPFLIGSVNIGVLGPTLGQPHFGEGKSNFNNITPKKGGSRDKIKKSHKERKKNPIISKFYKIEDFFDISSEEGENHQIIDDELHSDDDNNLENKIQLPKTLTKSYQKDLHSKIPKIELNQIEFNKQKIHDDADLYSLKRRKYKWQNIDANIKDYEKKIKDMKEKLDFIKKKEKIMKEYIDKIEDKYNILKSMRVQTSVYNKEVPKMLKSLRNNGNDNEINEDFSDDGNYNIYGSDYENEDDENSDNEKYKKNDLKKSVFVGGEKELKSKNKINKLQKSTPFNGFFKNKLRDKLNKGERAQSK